MSYQRFVRLGKEVIRRERWAGGREVSARGLRRCTYIRSTGERCKKSAIMGKDKCGDHGGLTPVQHGGYSKYLKATMREALADAANASDDIRDELDLSRALLRRALQLYERAVKQLESRPLSEIAVLRELQEHSKTVSTLAEQQAKIVERRSITPEQVEVVLHGILRVLQRHVSDSVLRSVAADMREIKWPAGVKVTARDPQSELACLSD